MSDSKRRTRLNLPLRLSQFSSQLCQKVRSIFPEIQDSNLYYVDGEGDSIIVDGDADLVARDVLKGIGRVPSFVVKKAAPPPQSSSKPRSKQVFRSIAHVRSVTTVYEFPVGKKCWKRTIRTPRTMWVIIVAMIAILKIGTFISILNQRQQSATTLTQQSSDDSLCSLHQHEKYDDIKKMYVIENMKARGEYLNVYKASFSNGAKIAVRGVLMKGQNTYNKTHNHTAHISSCGTTLRCLKLNGLSNALKETSTIS